MCEIAILNPDAHSTDELTDAAMELYSAMKSSLGLVFITENPPQTAFEYEIYKAVAPSRDGVKTFIEKRRDDGIRLIIHGRMATHGDVTVKNAHPITINCDECDVDYVLHNGVVTTHRQVRDETEKHGHEYETDVDSEVIAHQYGEVPTDFEQNPMFAKERSYILLNKDAAYIYSSGTYHLTKWGTMSLSYRTFGPEASQDSYQEVILTPTNAE